MYRCFIRLLDSTGFFCYQGLHICRKFSYIIFAYCKVFCGLCNSCDSVCLGLEHSKIWWASISFYFFSFHRSSFKLIIPEPVEFSTFYLGELSTCYTAVNKSQEWSGGGDNITDIEAKPSIEVDIEGSRPLYFSDFKNVFLRSCKFSRARRLKWKHYFARPASEQMWFMILGSLSLQISSSWLPFLLLFWHTST